MLDAHGGVAVAQLIVYVPALVATILICLRHGFSKSSGWIYTHILCLVRIVGAICRLVSIYHPSIGLFTTIAILDSVGISPLLLATLGMLQRYVNFVQMNGSTMFKPLHFRLIYLIVLIGLILGIVGGNTMKIEPGQTFKAPVTSKVGVALYCIGWIAIATITALTFRKVHYVPSKEQRVPYAVMAALPFILIRLIYSVLSISMHNSIFGLVGGNVVAWIIMSVIQEIVVIYIYVLLGFNLDKLDASQKGPLLVRAKKGAASVQRESHEQGHYAMNTRVAGDDGGEHGFIPGNVSSGRV